LDEQPLNYKFSNVAKIGHPIKNVSVFKSLPPPSPQQYKLCTLSDFWKPLLGSNQPIGSKHGAFAIFEVLYHTTNLIFINQLILKTCSQYFTRF